ncbi:MAG: diacylglycerol/lipid kinase family protein, partial [Candidatus Dormibacteraceae bacterium]
MKKALVIVNPASAGGRNGSRWQTVAKALRQAGLEFDFTFTERPAQATELAREAVLAGRELVVAAGGDGTINEVASGFFEAGDPIDTHSRLGVLPLGTGSDFCRTVGVPKDFAAAGRLLVEGTPRPIDVGRVTYRCADGSSGLGYFLNVADVGIGGEVVRRVRNGFWLFNGEITLTVASLITLLQWRNQPMRVVIDGQVEEMIAQQVVVANCQYYGGGMQVAPRAEFDDGWFDVLIAGDLGRLESLRLIGPMRRGTHLEHGLEKLSWRRARTVEVSSPADLRFNLDGEQPGRLPVKFE